MAVNWEELAIKKRQQLLDSIPEEWRIPTHLLPPETQDDVTGFPESSGWFTAEELAITNSTVLELIPKLASGELKSETVTRAFCKRAAAAHQLVNCLSETCFDRALETAKALDERIAKGLGPIGPFHGLPISLKDNINLTGMDSTIGFACYIGDEAKSDAELATILFQAGAVPYVKTNVPTAMMMAESVNNVFGRTVNPQNRKLTSGGSSGGESALLLFKGSPLGIGTDIGGSLRIPAACTGAFTLRSSTGRFPTYGCRSGLPGQETVVSINGPLTRSIADLEYYSKAVVSAEPWNFDPRCLPIPWRSVSLPSKLKIAVMWHDGTVLPTPPVVRALRHTVEKLRAAGHEISEWSPEDQAEGLNLLARSYAADGGKSILGNMAKTGEPVRPEIAAFGAAPEVSGSEYWALHLRRNELQKRYLDRWKKAGIDAILAPATPYSGVENGKFKYSEYSGPRAGGEFADGFFFLLVGYTGVYNLVDYSAIVFPTGMTVDSAVDVYSADAPAPMSEADKVTRNDCTFSAPPPIPTRVLHYLLLTALGRQCGSGSRHADLPAVGRTTTGRGESHRDVQDRVGCLAVDGVDKPSMAWFLH
ncbi:amidase [Xylaria sp. CBS 124048]|nr:amidase [Xylaria sp. CBS 124048]